MHLRILGFRCVEYRVVHASLDQSSLLVCLCTGSNTGL